MYICEYIGIGMYVYTYMNEYIGMCVYIYIHRHVCIYVNT